jgi:predicted enzyme related to lactoylglutathione lyase
VQLQTVDGIATTQGGRAAWFKDSEGNILGLAQTS